MDVASSVAVHIHNGKDVALSTPLTKATRPMSSDSCKEPEWTCPSIWSALMQCDKGRKGSLKWVDAVACGGPVKWKPSFSKVAHWSILTQGEFHRACRNAAAKKESSLSLSNEGDDLVFMDEVVAALGEVIGEELDDKCGQFMHIVWKKIRNKTQKRCSGYFTYKNVKKFWHKRLSIRKNIFYAFADRCGRLTPRKFRRACRGHNPDVMELFGSFRKDQDDLGELESDQPHVATATAEGEGDNEDEESYRSSD